MFVYKIFKSMLVGFVVSFASVYGSAARITRLAAPISRSAAGIARSSMPVASIASLDAARNYSAASGAFKGSQSTMFRATAPQYMTQDEAFGVLNLPQGSSSAKIKSVYLEKAKQAHPDMGGSDQKMKDLNQAYQIAQGAQKSIIGSDFETSWSAQQSAKPKDDMYKVIQSGDAVAVENFIRKNPDMVNTVMYNTDLYSNYPLVHAMNEALRKEGSQGLDVIETLLKAGANPNAMYQKETPLIIAAETPSSFGDSKKQIDIVTMLLNAGADPNIPTDKGVFPLMLAVQRLDNQVAIEALCAAGAKLNQVSGLDAKGNSNTALSLAANYSNDQYVSLLLKYGADPNIKFSRNGKASTVLHMLVGKHVSYYKKSKDSFVARLLPDLKKTIQDVLKAGADISIKDGSGKTAYDYALEEGDTEVVELLKSAGARSAKEIKSMWSWVPDVWK